MLSSLSSSVRLDTLAVDGDPVLTRLTAVLKLNGVKATEHPIFTELTRVKQYFEKIKEAETGSAAASRKRLNVDAPAAKRFIQAALAGNDQQVGGRQQVKKRKAEQVEPETTTPRTKSQQNGTPLKQSQDAQDVPASSTSKANGVTPAAEQNDDDKGEDKEKKKKKKKNKHEKDGPTDDQTHKHKKRKSDKPPKDSKTIFNEFVNRADKAKG